MKKILLTLYLASSLFAFSYTAYPGISTGANTMSVTQFIYGNWAGFAGTDIYLGCGVTDVLDVTACVSANNAGPVTWSAMPRYAITKNILGAVRFSDAYAAPQIHANFDFGDMLTLQSNVALQYTFVPENLFSGYAVACPVLKLGKTGIDVGCDIIPVFCHKDDIVLGFTRTKGFSLDVVPEVGFSIGSGLFTLAAPLVNVTGEFVPTFGAWWVFIAGK